MFRFNLAAYRSGPLATILENGLDLLALTEDGLNLALCIGSAIGLRCHIKGFASWEIASSQLLVRLTQHPETRVQTAATLLIALKQPLVQQSAGEKMLNTQKAELQCLTSILTTSNDQTARGIAAAGLRRIEPEKEVWGAEADPGLIDEVLRWISEVRGEE